MNDEIELYRYVTEGSFDAYMWQNIEIKARFIHQVLSGQTSVRTADDLEGGALTYAEIKAVASGNPAVMEKVKVDTEIRKLDQPGPLTSTSTHIRWQIRNLPETIAESHRTLCQRANGHHYPRRARGRGIFDVCGKQGILGQGRARRRPKL